MTDETAVRETLEEYYRAFSTLSVQAILPYLNQPALLVGPLGAIPLPIPRRSNRSSVLLWRVFEGADTLGVNWARRRFGYWVQILCSQLGLPSVTGRTERNWNAQASAICCARQTALGSLSSWCCTVRLRRDRFLRFLRWWLKS